jgi:methionine-rich copper-binding protein CopC
LALTPLLGLLLAISVAIVPASPAATHSLLLGSTPAPDAVVTASPRHVRLRFNNRIETRLSRVRLVDERGLVAAAPIAPADSPAPESLQAAVPPLTPGVWRVEWQVFSTDGHVVSGSYAFRLAP